MTARASSPPGLRAGVRTAAALLAVLLVGWGVLVLASLLLRTEDAETQEFGGVTALVVDAGFESVEVVGSTGAASVTVARTGSWSLIAPSRTAAVHDGRLSVSSDCHLSAGRGCGGRLRVVVPADLPVTVSSGDGDLVLTGLTGRVTAATTDGTVHARGLTGALSVTTGDGGLTGVALGSSQVTVSSGDGAVELAFDDPPEAVTVHSGDGAVTVAVPDDDGPYRVGARADDAAATVSVPTDRRSDRHIDVSTGDGAIRVVSAS